MDMFSDKYRAKITQFFGIFGDQVERNENLEREARNILMSHLALTSKHAFDALRTVWRYSFEGFQQKGGGAFGVREVGIPAISPSNEGRL